MIEYIINNFYPISGSILISCFVAFLVWRNNFKNRQAVASATFRAAFTDTLQALKYESDIDTTVILQNGFAAHETSVLEFSRFINYFKRKAFMSSWYEYAYYEDRAKYPHPFFEQYTKGGCNITEANNRKKLAISRLEHILSFADYV